MTGHRGTRSHGSIAAAQEQIVREMAGLPDGLARYEYLVRVGRQLKVPDEHVRRDANLVAGCQVRVWIHAELREDVLRIAADSDAMINRGIIALLLRVLDGRPPDAVRDADLFFLDRTELREHLSPARGNGLAAMVRRIRELAAESAGTSRSATGAAPDTGSSGPASRT